MAYLLPLISLCSGELEGVGVGWTESKSTLRLALKRKINAQ
jgi:hypothetical protein